MWLAVIAAAACLAAVGSAEFTIYGKLGDAVVLQPGVTGPFTNILWKHGAAIAMELEGSSVEAYRQFLGRGALNVTSGALMIGGLVETDGGLYTPEVDGSPLTPTRLIVLSPVPVPTVSVSCNDEKTACTLTCDGNTAGAEPVTYAWRFGDPLRTSSSKEHVATKEDSSDVSEFTCELRNPVSRESSRPAPSPFASTAGGGGLKIHAGLTVFICLLTAVLLLALVHRCKTGKWFYQKASMPWEAEFWRKQEKSCADASETGAANAHQVKARTDEETPMA